MNMVSYEPLSFFLLFILLLPRLHYKQLHTFSPRVLCKKELKLKAIVWYLLKNRNNSERRERDGQQKG
jgi:hypothetical protein